MNNNKINVTEGEVNAWFNADNLHNTNTLNFLQKLFTDISTKHVLNPETSGFVNYFPYFPTPQVGHVLRQLHSLKPDYFTPLHIVCRDIDAGNKEAICKNSFTVWLPKLPEETHQPEKGHLADEDKTQEEGSTRLMEIYNAIKGEDDDAVLIWKDCGKNWHENPELLIARYAAAMAIGRAVSFAPREIGLDYYSEEARKQWGTLIDRAIRENGGHVMQVYTTMINCKPSRFYRYENLPTYAETVTLSEYFLNKLQEAQPDKYQSLKNQFPDDKYILGIDIGGTAVKVYSFSLEGLGGLNNNTPKITPKPDAGKLDIDVDNLKEPVRSYDANDFINKLFTEIDTKDKDLLQNCVAVGFSLAAPVNKKTGVPTARSGALTTYFGAAKDIISTNPMDLHKIELVQAVQHWVKDAHPKHPGLVVSVLNDGDADIKDSSDTRSQLKEGVSVVVKAGTGVAVAVFEDNKLVEYKAESAKAILNLLTNVQAKPVNERFQEGCLGDYCSKKALIGLMQNLKPNNQKDDDDDGKVVNELLREVIGVAFSQLEHEENEDQKIWQIIDKYNNKGSLEIKQLKDFIELLDNEIEKHKAQLNEKMPGDSKQEKNEVKKIRQKIEGYKQKRQEIEIRLKIEEYKDSLEFDLLKHISEIQRQELFEQSIKVYNFNCYQNEIEQSAHKAEILRNDITWPAIKQPPPSPENKEKSSEVTTDWDKLGGSPGIKLQKLAIAISYVLGQWLADAIALVLDIYGAREVQLGGGPLAGYTGIFVTTAARMSLEKAYGFDIEVVLPSEQQPASLPLDIPNRRNKSRDLKSLRLIYPPFDSGVGGARGAAKAALEDWIQIKKQKQLLDCRDVVRTEKLSDSFTVKDVLEKAFSESELFISLEEVETMLVTESESLSLTRTARSKFKKL